MIKKLCLALSVLCLAGVLGCTAKEADEPVSTTLMVYMIGSDLEAKVGAATSDLEEMAASGIDLSRHKVVVCAGGSPYWHSREQQTEDRRILELTESGFLETAVFPSQSMGQAESLSSFLDYAVTNYPSQRYGLILWDHGNGPLEGYGRDMLFENDALLLEEMEQALESSVFGPERKLAFVGFDACLMASAELNCLWADYADYLVASQEVEPAFGWSYGFLADLGSRDIPALLTRITTDYLAACEAYYLEKGYENRDTTLSCVDLSKAPALEQALNALFEQAAREDQYNALAACRVQTRALGRSTTGSEYDLVDLGDLALQLKALYPEEAGALEAAVSDMVIANATNTTGCSGMSLYFPFYNKRYYQKSWQDTYSRMQTFPAYRQYLQTYEKNWLDTDTASVFSTGFTPTAQAGSYTLTMTPEQAENYASARYYILRRESQQMYNYLFISSDVTRTGNVLTANFDGKIIYVKDMYETYHIPVSIEHEKIGNKVHYSVPFSLSAHREDAQQLLTDITGARYHLVLDTETDKISVSALLPNDGNVDATTLMNGKLEDIVLTDYLKATFWEREHSYLTRDENGAILPLDQWHQNSWFTAMEYYCADDLQLVYEPLSGGEYYLMMEVQDTRGNRFCSELLPIQVPQREWPDYEMPQVEIPWDSGDTVKLWEDENMEFSLIAVEVTGKIKYTLELRNRSASTLDLRAYSLLCNDRIICNSSDYIGAMTVPPGQSSWFSSWMDLGTAELVGDLTQLKKIQFNVLIRDAINGTSLLPWTQFEISLSDSLSQQFSARQEQIPFSAEPLYGARAEEQVLADNEEMKVTLLGLGTLTDADLMTPQYVLRVENKTDGPLTLSMEGMALNSIYFAGGSKLTLPGHHTGYLSGTVPIYDLSDMDITQIYSVQLLISTVTNDSIAGGFSKPVWYALELAEQGALQPFREAGTVIYEKDGVRIALDLEEYFYSGSADPTFRMTVYNGSQQNILPKIRNVTVNGIPVSENDTELSIFFIDGGCGPAQYGSGILFCDRDGGQKQTLTFNIQLMDINEEYVLYTDTKTVTLHLNLETREARYEKK